MRLRGPLFLYLGNLVLLAFILLIAFFAPAGIKPYAIAVLALTQGVLILLVGMELIRDPPLMRLFAGIAGFWLTILLTFTMFDYLTR
jgi:cytochrome c oxidase subunit IV